MKSTCEVNPADLTSGRTLDHAAVVYDVLSPVMTLGLERGYRQKAIQLMQLTGSEQVLDIGCGTGTLTREISAALSNKADSKVVGIDAALKMIEIARRKAARISNIQFDAEIAEKLPYADEAFHIAVSTFFYHHINYELKVRSLNEIHRTMKAGGRLIIVDVDIPTHWFGKVCAWSGYWLFKQEEIRENIEGRLRDALDESLFSAWRVVSHHAGHITIFEIIK